jgi:hypothetical protein
LVFNKGRLDSKPSMLEKFMHFLVSNKQLVPFLRIACFCIVTAAVAALAAGWAQPVQAGGAGLSYQEVTRLMFQQQTTPAPGTYFTGSFQGDYQQAMSAAAPRTGGFLGTIKWAMGAVNELRNGRADTQYYWNGMHREDSPDQTATIDIPAKNEIIELNLANKTYTIVDTTPKAMPAGSMEPMPQMPQGSIPPQKPGTVVVTITTKIKNLGPKLLDNIPTQGYAVTSSVSWSQATGSCKSDSGDFQAGSEMVEFFSKYQQPQLAQPPMPKAMPTALPSMPSMASIESLLQSLKQAMATGCKPTIKKNIQRGANLPYSGLVVWQYFGGQANMQDQSAQQAGQEQMQELGALSGQSGGGTPGFGTVIERGNVRVLGPADASLFRVPPGFTKINTVQR